MVGGAWRAEQVGVTREALMVAAERLFAEHGVYSVTHRQIAQAAGQGNNAAVSYHFGTKADLIRAIARKHAERMERTRARMLGGIDGSTELRDWVAGLVRPVTGHLDALGSPSWYARFAAQVRADPALHARVVEDSFAAAPALQQLLDGLARCLPDLPLEVHAERAVMARHLVSQMAVDRERALAEGAPTFHATWDDAAASLIEVIVALWCAPAP